MSKHYPTDPRGATDDGISVTVNWCHPSRVCSKRIDHPQQGGIVTWCTLPEHGPETQCSGPAPRVIELDDTGPGSAGRRRW